MQPNVTDEALAGPRALVYIHTLQNSRSLKLSALQLLQKCSKWASRTPPRPL